ncbi:CSC1-like protein 1 [Pyxicephalus adspersus]|uniref:CSC1-like protein 1 n=1 Tax=Pyxicephalus adspersus TaxID=30357 RepID=UPI003B5B14DB
MVSRLRKILAAIFEPAMEILQRMKFFENFVSVLNLSYVLEAEERQSVCYEGSFSSSRMDFMGFGGVVLMFLMSIITGLLCVMTFLAIRKVWNFGHIVLVHESDRFLYTNCHKPDETALEIEQKRSWYSWITCFLSISCTDIYERCGEDARHYLTFQRRMINFFAVATVVSLGFLVPMNIRGTAFGKNSTSFTMTTTGNVQNRDDFLWIHSVVAVLLSASLFFYMRKHASSIHYSDEDMVKHTIFITGLPQSADEETILKHFSEAYPTCKLLNIHLCRDVSEIIKINQKRHEACKNLGYYTNFLKTTGKQVTINPTRLGCLCCCPLQRCQQDAIEHYKTLKTNLEEQYEKKMEAIHQSHIGMAFVTFTEKSMASGILSDFKTKCQRKPQSSVSDQIQISQWSVSEAHFPEDIYWGNLTVRGFNWWACFVVINTILFIILLYLSTPQSIFTSLDSGPIYYLNRAFFFFPTIQLVTFAVLLRNIICFSIPFERHWLRSSEQKSMICKMFFFLIFMVLISPALNLNSLYSFFTWLFKSLHVTGHIRLECIFRPHKGAVAIHYIIFAAFMANMLDLLRLPEFLWYMLRMALARSTAERITIMQHQAQEFPFGEMYARMLCVITLAMAYSNICPVVIPCALIYLIVKRRVDMYNFYYVHCPSKLSKGVHEKAVELSYAGPFFNLLWLFLFCLVKRGNMYFNNWT